MKLLLASVNYFIYLFIFFLFSLFFVYFSLPSSSPPPLGTSDTLFLLNNNPNQTISTSVSVFCGVFCPQNEKKETGEGEGGEGGTCLCLLCYKNGSKSREYFKRKWLNHEDRYIINQ